MMGVMYSGRSLFAVIFLLVLELHPRLSMNWSDEKYGGCRGAVKVIESYQDVLEGSVDAMECSVKRIGEVTTKIRNYCKYN